MKIAEKSKDTEQFLEGLYNRYKRLLLSIIRKYVGQSHVSEDIFHEVFIRIILHSEKLSAMPTHKMEAYIVLIARGVSIDYLRKEHKLEMVDIEDESLQNNKCNTFTAPHDLFSRVDLSLMMCSLSEEEKALLMERYYFDLSTKELTQRFGGSEIAMRSKIHRAKNKLLAEWAQSGLKMEDFLDEYVGYAEGKIK